MLLTSTGRTSSPLKALEVEVELEADAAAVGAGMVAVSEAPDVVDTQDSKDVVEADSGFHIGLVAHGLTGGVIREQEDVGVHVGVVFIA